MVGLLNFRVSFNQFLNLPRHSADMVHLKHNFQRISHPLGAKIIFSYGMTKCGSTLAFELARTSLELSGFPQPVLPINALGQSKRINFTRHLTEKQINNLESAVQDVGYPIVIKTHTRPDPAVIDMIERGKAIVHATYRDPREMALSMLDHGRMARLMGRSAFSEIETIDDALGNIRGQIDSLTQWLYRPNCLPLFYHDLAFRMPLVTKRIMTNLHIEGSERIVKRHVLKKRFIQFNKGVKKRYKLEMSANDQYRIRQEFLPFYRTLIRNRMFLPTDGAPILKEGTVLTKSRGDTGQALS